MLRSWSFSKKVISNRRPKRLQWDSNPETLNSYTNTKPFSQTGQMVEWSFTN